MLLMGKGMFAQSLRTLPCAICLPVSLGQREMSLVGLEGQEQPERGTDRACPSSPVGWMLSAGLLLLQNGGRHRAKSRQVLHGC